MKKILVTSDIHVGNWKDFDKGPGFRKNQFLQLARRFIRLGIKNNTKILFIAGDLIEKAVSDPRVQHLLWAFFKILCSYFEEIYFIFGQHDLDSKSDLHTLEDSIVSLLQDFPQVHYMHNKVLNIGSRKIFFSDFQFKKDIRCEAPEHVDIWISHVTLIQGFGQNILNPEQYDLGLFGDIHNIVDLGKNHSINVPLQHDLKCGHYGTIVVLDLDTLEFVRIPTKDEEFDPLVIAYDDEYIDETYHNVVRVPRPLKVIAEAVDTNESSELFNIDKHLDEAIPEEYQDLLKEVRARLVTTEFDRINLNFKIEKLWAKNYWSAKYAEFNFDGKTLINFIGRNGSGKTTVTKMLQSLFKGKADLKYLGDKFAKDENGRKIDNPEVEVGGDLEYLGTKYRIIRNSHTGTKFWINGEEQTKNTQPQLEKKILECLPFTQMMNFFILRNGSEFFNPQSRVKLIYQAFNLDKLQHYFQTAHNIFIEHNKIFNENKIELNKNDGAITSTSELIASASAEAEKIKKLIKVSNIEDAYPRYETLKEEISNLESQISALKSNLPVLEPTSTTEEQYQNNKAALADTEKKILDLGVIKATYSENLKRLTKDLNELTEEKNTGVCPRCGRPYEKDEAHVKELEAKISEKSKEIEALKASYTTDSELQKLYQAQSTFKETIRKYEAYKTNKATYDNLMNSINSLQATLDMKKSDRLMQYEETLKTDWDNWNKYKNKLSEVDTLNNKLTELTTKKDELQAKDKELEADVKKIADFKSMLDSRNNDGVVTKLITNLCKLISNDQIVFKFQNGTVIVHLKVQGEWVEYDRTSGGQRVVTDLLILQRFLKLLGTVGFMSFDEFLSPCDYVVFEDCVKIMEDLNYNLAFYISQADTFNISCKRVNCELIDNYSQYTEIF